MTVQSKPEYFSNLAYSFNSSQDFWNNPHPLFPGDIIKVQNRVRDRIEEESYAYVPTDNQGIRRCVGKPLTRPQAFSEALSGLSSRIEVYRPPHARNREAIVASFEGNQALEQACQKAINSGGSLLQYGDIISALSRQAEDAESERLQRYVYARPEISSHRLALMGWALDDRDIPQGELRTVPEAGANTIEIRRRRPHSWLVPTDSISQEQIDAYEDKMRMYADAIGRTEWTVPTSSDRKEGKRHN